MNTANSTFDNNYQFYVFYDSLSFFINFFLTSFSINFLIIDRSTFWSSIDYQTINFARRNSLNLIMNQKRHLSTIFQIFERCWSQIERKYRHQNQKEVKMLQKVNIKWELSMSWNVRLFRTDVIKRIILVLLSDVSYKIFWKTSYCCRRRWRWRGEKVKIKVWGGIK